ncbi:MAG: nitroreductase family protein [Firmicutes bacterium]|nr:nitroreductase family protein [Bacillota bacterium]
MDLMKLLETRRTYRRFDQSREIPQEVIEKMMAAQRLASCSVNSQRLRYIVVKTPELVEKVFPNTKWAARLPKEQGTPKEGERPTLFVLVVYEKDKKHKWIDTDAGLAMSNITLAAWSEGVGSCILDSVDRPEVMKVLNLDDNLEIQSVIAFGYPVHESHIVEPKSKDELGYYLDENRDYCVPKLDVDDVVTYL